MQQNKRMNMKIFIAALGLLVSVSGFAQQAVREQFEKITTLPQAQAWVTAHPELKPEILSLSNGKDTALIDKRLLRQKKGDVFAVGYTVYKVIEMKDTVDFRANYIFLDGGSLSNSEIDSLKKIIVAKLNAGTPIEQLSDQYTMDGNKTKGDTGWFYGEYSFPKEFQDAVEAHKLGEVFFVDVTEKQWHYIVKKTHDDRRKKDIVVLKATGR